MFPKDQREVLVLRHFAGLSPAEIATRTGRSEGSVRGLHHRGRGALKAKLTSRGVAPATLSAPRPTPRSSDHPPSMTGRAESAADLRDLASERSS